MIFMPRAGIAEGVALVTAAMRDLRNWVWCQAGRPLVFRASRGPRPNHLLTHKRRSARNPHWGTSPGQVAGCRFHADGAVSVG
jgi:hypothetical protein